ncbi:MAG: hypothetical protein AAFP02_01150 [Bacteroidota bacterium]
MKSLTIRFALRQQAVLLWGGAILMLLLASCGGETQKASLKPIAIPDQVFSIKGEVLGFEASGSGQAFTQSVDVSSLRKLVEKMDDVLVYEFDPKGNGQLLEHEYQDGTLTALFQPGNRYFIYPTPFGRLGDTYRALCLLRGVSIRHRLNPGLIDPTCLVILCANMRLGRDEIVQRMPEFAPYIDELAELDQLDFGGLEPGVRTRQVGLGGDLCDRCLGFGRDVLIPDPRCERPPRLDPPPQPDVSVINMVPAGNSAETSQDSEPFLTVDRSDPTQMVGSAFTPNPFGIGGGTAPIYVSNDGGNTWILNNIVPSASALTGTGDITVAASQNADQLYAGILRRPTITRTMDILQTNNYNNPAAMVNNFTQQQPDQPFVQAQTVGANDRVYVGNNDLSLTNNTAVIDMSFDGGANYNQTVLDPRTVSNQNGPSVRPTISGDGTVYAAYFGWRNVTGVSADSRTATITSDIVVVRDDNGGTGTNPFTDLTDPSDGLAGRLVATGRVIPWRNNQFLGPERTGSTLTCAVHPTNSQIVYVAWADGGGATDLYTLHLRMSSDGGATWSRDLRTIRNATCMALAIAPNGAVGFLYQAFNDNRWITRLEQSRNAFETRVNTVLASTPGTTPAPAFLPYLGDYNFLLTVGNEFRGVFSANNTPDNLNFPEGVVYQRSANFTTITLDDGTGNPVAVSIDPFYFTVEAL